MMIKFLYWEVSGIPAAITGMRFPYKSTDNRDSFYVGDDWYFQIGEKDHKLAMQLSAAGTDHGKYLRMIHCQAKVKAPLYWWKEYDTYKVGTVSNSESTMHTIAKVKFTLDDFSHEYMVGPVTLSKKGRGGYWHTINLAGVFESLVCDLNLIREKYLETKDKELWYAMIQMLPTSYNQVRMIDLDYQVLQNIYHARKDHKLDEWREFCDWIKRLPYSELITGEDER